MSRLTIYKVVAKTNPWDWATMPDYATIEFYQSRESAIKKCQEMMDDKDFYMSWSSVYVEEIEVQP